jgi:hypothetical protein
MRSLAILFALLLAAGDNRIQIIDYTQGVFSDTCGLTETLSPNLEAYPGAPLGLINLEAGCNNSGG